MRVYFYLFMCIDFLFAIHTSCLKLPSSQLIVTIRYQTTHTSLPSIKQRPSIFSDAVDDEKTTGFRACDSMATRISLRKLYDRDQYSEQEKVGNEREISR
ncbi:hypothetical protein BO99DRAFT_60855 [Aspergillus violaceofuscus CBS 115571]|uniref:Secreted protein n=1 Tax=Aspergillus violaceofuscus (strain CBS 115571) TaxID=1450538 RepID=A0A2V5HBD9_ASPV1|nr:hypothetical protein BO99DRAFT_60855 [Aspergillus violaceofuscus CBS 115571]